MKKGLLIAILTALACVVRADGIKNVDDYCRLIDEAIEHSGDYVAAHEKKISEVRRALSLESKPRAKYERNYQLYELYRPFVSDSAIYFLGVTKPLQ